MKPLPSLIILILSAALFSCEPITEPEQYPIHYTGIIIYDIPSLHDTALSVREVYPDSIVWWQSKHVVNYTSIINGKYPINNVAMITTRSSCADSVALVHNGSGFIQGDSMFESGTVEYYIKVGVIEIRQVGKWEAKLCLISTH